MAFGRLRVLPNSAMDRLLYLISYGDGAPRAIVELVDSPNSVFNHPLYRAIESDKKQ